MSKDLNDVFNEFLLSMVNESNVNLIKELRVRWRMYLSEPIVDFKRAATPSFYEVDTSTWKVIKTEFHHFPNYFETEWEAKDYVALNKPCLCINDTLKALRDIFEETGEFKPSPGAISQKLKELSKLKTGSADR